MRVPASTLADNLMARRSRQWGNLYSSLFKLLFVFLFVPPVASAAGVTMQVEPAFGGHFKTGEWLPLRITVANDGRGRQVRVRVEMQVAGRPTAYIATSDLPAGQLKRLTLYVQPPASTPTLRVRLLEGEQELTAQTVSVTAEPYAHYVVGVISPRSQVFSALGTLTLNNLQMRMEPKGDIRALDPRPVKVLPVTMSDLPDRLEGLRTLDALVISGADTRDLSMEQGRAVQSWVDRGGRLILGGGSTATQTLSGLPRELVGDFEPLGATIDLLSLQTFGAFAGTSAPAGGRFAATLPAGGEVLIEQEGHPLLVEKHYGRGHVDYAALDLTAHSFDAWTGWPPFWDRLLSPRSTLANRQRAISPQPDGMRILYTLQNLPAPPFPPINALVGLGGLLVLLAVTVSHLVLRRWRRLVRIWLTIAVLIVLLAGLAFWRDLGDPVTIQQLSIVNLSPRAPVPMTTFISLASSEPTTHTLTMPNDALVGHVTMVGLSDPPLGYDVPVEVVQGDRLQIRGAQSDPRSLQAFRIESPLPAGWGLEAKLAVEGDRLRGALVNHTGAVIHDAAFVDGYHYARVGDLVPGQPRVLDQTLEGRSEWPKYSPILGLSLDPKRGAPSELPRLRSDFMSAYYQSVGGLAGFPSTLLVVGWIDISRLPIQVSSLRSSARQMSLVLAQLDPQDVAGPVNIVPGATWPHVVDLQGDADFCGGLNVSLGSAVLEFELPEEIMPLRLTRLVLTRSGTLATELQALERSGTWVKLESPYPGYYDIPDPARFLLPGYIVRLRVLGVKGIPACDSYELFAEGER